MNTVNGKDVAWQNVYSLLRMYNTVDQGVAQEARGTKSRNARNVSIVLDMNFNCLTSFTARRLNILYAKKEWLWYLEGNKYADWIEKYSSMWAKLKQADGTYYSNYGQYIFHHPEDIYRSQFMYVVQTLLTDQHSRRASIVLLQPGHLYPENTDVVCTYAINFCIENMRLHMTVMMRSNDVIYGFTNDSFAFWQLYEFVFVLLKQQMPALIRGTYTHFANSLHVYERHYTMIDEILRAGIKGYEYIEVPRPTIADVNHLLNNPMVPYESEYTRWLQAES